MRNPLAAILLSLSVLWGAGAVHAQDPQGQAATLHGAGFERGIARAITAKGFVLRSYLDWHKAGEPAGEWLLTNVPYVTLYGSPGRTEFLLVSQRRGLRIRIEAKWQQRPGSVDEKLPHLYLNALSAMPEDTVFIVIDGPGWRPGSLDWLRKAAAERRYAQGSEKRIVVMSLAEFRDWAGSPNTSLQNE